MEISIVLKMITVRLEYSDAVCHAVLLYSVDWTKTYEPVHEIFNKLVCATSKASDQPAHMRSLIRDFASRLSIL